MAKWDEGYVTDVAYTRDFYREITPVWLTTASLMLGHRSPDLAKPFSYADIGCGHGFTALWSPRRARTLMSTGLTSTQRISSSPTAWRIRPVCATCGLLSPHSPSLRGAFCLTSTLWSRTAS